MNLVFKKAEDLKINQICYMHLNGTAKAEFKGFIKDGLGELSPAYYIFDSQKFGYRISVFVLGKSYAYVEE